MSFFGELKRRKVFRVAVVYAATAFVILQAAELMLPRLGIPEWVSALIVVLVILGFPIALILAWALELTPDGIKRTGPVRAGDAVQGGLDTPDAPPALLGKRTVFAAVLLVAVGTGIGAGWFLRPVTGPDVAPSPQPVAERAAEVPAVADRSIAVLPFADFSPGGEQEWFADGLAEEILNALARLPDLRVASRTGSFQFRDGAGDVRSIADSLGVAHILEGSVRRAGDQVRITAQLIRTADNAHLWSQNFDREATDVIRVQEEIAYEIARTLQTALDPEELARLLAAGTNSVAAYEALLRARDLENRSIELEDWDLMLQSLAAIEEARLLDPQFYRAHAEAARFWVRQLTLSQRDFGITGLSAKEREARALESLRAAETAAPDRLGRLEQERARARLELRLRDALTLSQQIVELMPDGESWNQLGISAAAIGRYDLARQAYREAAKRFEEVRFGITDLATQYHRVDPQAALELADRWLADRTAKLDDIYQAHRTLLAGGRIEEAKSLAEMYLESSTSLSGRILVQIRQLCGEGRTGDAWAYYDALGDVLAERQVHEYELMIRWLALNYLGRSDEATKLLRPYDEAGELFTLSTFLVYTFFDPRAYPNLSAALRRNGALRTEPLPIPYACPPLVDASGTGDLETNLEERS